jgi:uncharacterized membrane protein
VTNTRRATTIGVVGMILGLIGLAVAIYLTVAHYDSAKVLACPDTGVINCAKVTTSSYSMQLGIPLAVWGLGFFVVTLGFQNPWAWRSTQRWVRTGRLLLAGSGAIGALALIWVELFRLDAICLYCTAVHALSIVFFILTGLGTAATLVDDDSEFEPELDDVEHLAEV